MDRHFLINNLKIFIFRWQDCIRFKNAATACEVLLALQRIEQTENKCEKTSKKSVYSMEAIRNGFLKTKWKGRFTCIHENPVFIVDGAHNEDAQSN